MPVSSFVPAVLFVWPAPKAEPAPEVPAPAPPTDAERRTAAAVRLVRRFRAVEKSSPEAWRFTARLDSPRIGYSGVAPAGGQARWSHLASRDVRDGAGLLYCADPADVPGLPALCRALRTCGTLANGIDPTDPTAATFAATILQILRATWSAGAFMPQADGTHRIAVTYPAELLARLREWAEAEPPRVGRKPDPTLQAIADRCRALDLEGALWKEMPRRIAAEFGRHYEPDSLRKLCARHPGAKCGTE